MFVVAMEAIHYSEPRNDSVCGPLAFFLSNLRLFIFSYLGFQRSRSGPNQHVLNIKAVKLRSVAF